jgi:hypothetical protein
MSAAAAAAPAAGGVDHAALSTMARHAGVEAGDHAPLIMYTAGEPATGHDGGAYAWDVSRRAAETEKQAGQCFGHDFTFESQPIRPQVAVMPVDGEKGWLSDIGNTPVTLRVLCRNHRNLDAYELPPAEDDSWTVTNKATLVEVAKSGIVVSAWQPGICQVSRRPACSHQVESPVDDCVIRSLPSCRWQVPHVFSTPLLHAVVAAIAGLVLRLRWQPLPLLRPGG